MIDPTDLPFEVAAPGVPTGRVTHRRSPKWKVSGTDAPRARTPQATRNKRNGRSFELRLARYLADETGEKVTCSSALVGDVDLQGETFVAEAKRWSRMPAKLRNALEQLEKREAHGKDKRLYVEYHQPGKRSRLFIVIEDPRWRGRAR